MWLPGVEGGVGKPGRYCSKSISSGFMMIRSGDLTQHSDLLMMSPALSTLICDPVEGIFVCAHT